MNEPLAALVAAVPAPCQHGGTVIDGPANARRTRHWECKCVADFREALLAAIPPDAVLVTEETAERRRFWSKVTTGSREECWSWSGRITDHGYGSFSVHRRPYPAHRYAFECLFGHLASDRVIDHLCRNRACVNPFHMEATDHRTNILRGVGPTAVNARRELCHAGHDAWVPEKRGRACRECAMLRQRKHRAALRANP